MSYTQKKFVDAEGLQHFAEKLNEYPNNEVLATVINAIEEEIPEVPVQDVQVNGTSILNNGVASVPVASSSNLGVIKPGNGFEVSSVDTGKINVVQAYSANIKQGTSYYAEITPATQHEAAFYGLAKVAGADMKDIANTTVGTYPDAQKAAIQSMLGITQMLAPENPNLIASQAYTIGDVFAANGHLYKATAAIAQDGTIIPDTNCVETTMAEAGGKIKDVQVNGASIVQNGVANVPQGSGTARGVFMLAREAEIKEGVSIARALTPGEQHTSTFYALAKAAGDTTQSQSANAVGTYTAEAKAAIQTMLDVPSKQDIADIIVIQSTQPTDPDTKIWIDDDASGSVQVPTVSEMESALAGKVGDVQVNGTSIVSNGVADMPIASNSNLGVVKVSNSYGLDMYSGFVTIKVPTDVEIKTSAQFYRPITPSNQHKSIFYGLAKAAGDTTQSQSDNAVGTYTDEAKQSIQQMLGVSSLLAPSEPTLIASKAYVVGDVFTANGKLYKVTSAIAATETIVVQNEGETVSGHNAEECNISNEFIKKTDYASTNDYGIVKIGNGLTISNNKLSIQTAGSATIKQGTASGSVITPEHEYEAAFYGLAKAAGDATQAASNNAVGTYTDEAKAAIRTMVGAVGTTDYANSTNAGVIKVASNGIILNSSGVLTPQIAIESDIKTGTTTTKLQVPANQHISTFYGLAKASGDTTQSQSDNAVGTYTDSAKASIKSMLGIVDGSTGTVTVTGTTPTITAIENTRYVCGEVATLSITPPASGICIIRFTSGTTATVLTATGVVWPEWFDATALETERVYEICITDGYGMVVSWAQ